MYTWRHMFHPKNNKNSVHTLTLKYLPGERRTGCAKRGKKLINQIASSVSVSLLLTQWPSAAGHIYINANLGSHVCIPHPL